VTDEPLACKLTDAELRARREGLLATARRLVTQASWRGDGLVLDLAPTPETRTVVLELVKVEGECCPFLRFDLSSGPDGMSTQLAIMGPPGTRAFLESLGFAAV
jgi:hypothetical protein